jgi:prepilin-type N-terminal cleavage/methylation domain-containing protein
MKMAFWAKAVPAERGYRFSRVLKNCASGRDPALRGSCKWTAHPADGGTALSKTPRALADSLIFVFQHPVRNDQRGYLLLEIMVAIAIFSIGFLAVGTMIISTTRNNTTGNILTQATLLAEETLEDLKKEALGSLIAGGPTTTPKPDRRMG